MIPWSSYIPAVREIVNIQIPDPFISAAIRDAAADLCSKAFAWVEALDPIALQENQSEYEVDLPENTSVVRVTDARLKNSSGEVDITQEDDGSVRYSLDGIILTLDPAPDASEAAYDLYLRAALKPTPVSYEGPGKLYDEYRMPIVNRALYKLFMMKGRDWYDPNLAVVFKEDYREELPSVRGDFDKGKTKRPLRTRTWP